jgi:hypothetical protein
MSESEYWGHVRGLWDERQAVIQKVYEQMVKTDELLTTLINTLSDAHTRPHHGEHLLRVRDWTSRRDTKEAGLETWRRGM